MKKPNYMNRIILLLLSFCSLTSSVHSQEVITAGIMDIIQSAQSDSPNFLIAKTSKNNAYWNFVSSRAIFKPQLNLAATLPSFDRSISPFTNPDGSRTFVPTSFMSNSVGLQLTQLIPATGGSVRVSSRINRLDNFGGVGRSTSYLSAPIGIFINQPLFGFNSLKWDKEEAEINFEASKKQYVEDREKIAFDAVNNFFDLYISKLTLEEAIRNSEYLDSLAVNAQGRYSVGRISETELLQIQLGAKNAKGTVASLNLNVQNKIEILRDFLGIKKEVDFDLITPSPLTVFSIDKEKAVEYATKNRSITENFRLRLLNAERIVENAKRTNGPSLNLNGSFGLNRSATVFGDAFQDLLDSEQISLSIDIPIADFGRSKAQKEIAKSNLERTQLLLQQDLVSFEREILLNVEQFKLKREQLQLSEEALNIAKKRVDISKKRFDIGKIDVTNLNIAIQEELSAQQRYYSALWDLWRAHYTIRNLTLYDFENNVPLE